MNARRGGGGLGPGAAQAVLPWAPSAVFCVRCGEACQRPRGRPPGQGTLCVPCREAEAREAAHRRGELLSWLLGRAMRSCRLAMGLNVYEMATRLGISERYLRRIERGKTPRDDLMATALRLAEMELIVELRPARRASVQAQPDVGAI